MNSNVSHPKRRSPLQAIRAFCLECEGSFDNVKNCLYPGCPFYAYRHGTRPEGQPHQPLKTIKTYCFEECQCGSSSYEVLTCQGDLAAIGPCPVFPFRMGKNPNISVETREKLRQIALLRDPLGLQDKTSQAHARFGALQSTKTGRAIDHHGSYENNIKNSRQSIPCDGKENN